MKCTYVYSLIIDIMSKMQGKDGFIPQQYSSSVLRFVDSYIQLYVGFLGGSGQSNTGFPWAFLCFSIVREWMLETLMFFDCSWMDAWDIDVMLTVVILDLEVYSRQSW